VFRLMCPLTPSNTAALRSTGRRRLHWRLVLKAARRVRNKSRRPSLGMPEPHERDDDMSEGDLLSVYRNMRATIEGIRDLAASIDSELARLQIYREREAIPRALGQVKALAEQGVLLEESFRLCADHSQSAEPIVTRG
jgi:hypothetical protein